MRSSRFGGTSPENMISYEAAEGEKVIVKGSVVLDDKWKHPEDGLYPFMVKK